MQVLGGGPDGSGPGAVSDPGAAGSGILHGSCLCGDVAYRVRLPIKQFVHCHCSRCRKATGTGHATNLYVDPAQFEWVRGEGQLIRYDLPSARSFATTFCRACGSPLPHRTRSGRTVVVPAGSLDDEPPSPPRAHIFWDSRASWDRADEAAPRFAGYPEWWT